MVHDHNKNEQHEAGVLLAERVGLSLTFDPAPIPGGPQTISEAVRAAKRFGDIEALVGVDQRITYAQLEERVARAARALVDLGVRPLDRVAASLANCAEIVVAFLAVQRLGAIWVGVNQALATPEKVYILDHSEATVLLTDAATADAVRARGSDIPGLARIVVASATGEPSEWSARTSAAAPLDDDWPEPLPYLPAAIAYTSGTTGLPKGAVHSQHSILTPAVVQRGRLGYVEGARIGQALPLTILNIMIVGPMTTLVVGATTAAIDRNSARGVVAWCKQERLTKFLVAPPTIHDLVSADDITADDLAGVSHPGGGGGGITDELRAAFLAKFGTRCPVAYGMTEAPTAVVSEPDGDPSIPGSSGAVNPHVTITVRDDDGTVLPLGEDGELCVSGATSGPWAGVYTPMLGYWRQPEATAEAIGRGYYRTGDVGHLDANGWCYVRGRRSEMILRGGTNVYPAEIERIIAAVPGVRTCAVIGRPHERLGEEIVAFVERLPGHEVDVDALRDLCAANLSRYKVPAEFVVVDSLPRNQMDKVVRSKLSALAAELATAKPHDAASRPSSQ